MKREKFVKILLDFGFKQNTIDKIMQNKVTTTVKKAIKLEEDHGIPVSAWDNIKAYVAKKPNSSFPDDSIAS